MKKTHKLSDEQKIEIVELYKTGKYNGCQLGRMYNVHSNSILSLLKRRNIKTLFNRQKNTQKYNCDYHFLDKIDSEEKAYFLGFFFADGYNYETIGKIKIGLAKSDKEILYKITNLFKTNRPILKHQNKNPPNSQETYIFTISNKYLSNRLAELGAIQAKSKTIRFPKYLREDLVKHFIRGYFDGDGSISLSNRNIKKGKRIKAIINIISNYNFCYDLNNIIENQFNFKFGYSIDKRCENIAYLHMGTYDKTLKFLDWIYSDAKIYLERKFVKYRIFKLNLEKINREL